MKILKLVLLLTTITLTGCAHYVGYNRSYGYGTYGGGSYGVQGYYNHPISPYYRPGAVIQYGRRYTPAPRHRTWHPGPHTTPRNWTNKHSQQRHWKPHGNRHHHSGNNRPNPRHAWSHHRSRRDGSGSLGRLQHRPDNAPALLGEGRRQRHR